MPSTYTTNLGIEKIATGEQSGTWGTTTNTNFDLIDTAVNGIVSVTLASAGTSGSPNDLPITDGTASNGRNKFIEFVDGGDLGATAYVQLTPNNADKIVHIRNSLSGSRSIIVFQGTYNASNDFEIPNGADVTLKFNGGGTGATVTDVNVDLTVTGVTATSTASFSGATIDDLGTVTTADINGGTIDGTVIGGSSAAAGTFTTANATTVDATNIEVTNIKAKDGTAAGSIADSTGVVTLASSVLTTADINGGTADGVTIGGSSAAAGTFTTFTSTGIDDNATSTAITINSSQNVGIGTASPTTFSNQKSLTIDATTASRLDLQVGGTTYAGMFALAGESRLVATNGAVMTFDVGGGSERMRIDASGNVGIGTTSPDQTLHVHKGSAGTVASQANSVLTLENSTTSVLQFLSPNTASNQIRFGDPQDNGAGYIDYSHSSSALTFGVNGPERMRIDSAGNVGIGTSSPSFILGTGLHIDSSGYTSIVLQKGGAGQGHNIDFTDASNALQYRIGTNFASGGENLLFAYGSTPTIGMTLNSSGNVGIRTASPSYALDVVGAIRATNSSGSTIIVNRTSNPGSIELQHSGTQTANFQAISGGGVATYIGSSPSEAMRITSAGNVGIGTTSPAVKTQIVGSGAIFRISDDVSTSGTIDISASSSEAVIHANTYASAVPLVFKNASTERMRIDSSGNLLVGDTASISGGSEGIELRSDYGYIKTARNSTGSVGHWLLYNPNGNVGSVTTSGSATQYNTSSDERLKENIVDAPAGNIDAIRVRSFDWKAGGTHQPYGMIAQELVEVAPEAVSQGETEEDMWGVDYSKLVPMMIKEIQDLKAEVAALKGE